MKSSAPPAAAAEVVTGARRATFTPRAGTPLFERDPRRAAEADAAQETAAEEAMAAIRSLFAFGRGATAMDGGRALNSGAPRRVRSSHANLTEAMGVGRRAGEMTPSRSRRLTEGNDGKIHREPSFVGLFDPYKLFITADSTRRRLIDRLSPHHPDRAGARRARRLFFRTLGETGAPGRALREVTRAPTRRSSHRCIALRVGAGFLA
jgi:hypothetical protein